MRFIVSIDIGTVQSAVAVHFEDPGEFSDTDASTTQYHWQLCLGGLLETSVNNWPGQESAMWNEKVPSALLYGHDESVNIIHILTIWPILIMPIIVNGVRH